MDKKIKDIAARIKDLREFSDYSIADFANKVNMTIEDYTKLEQGEMDIPIGIMYNIAAALEIDPTVLLTGQNSDRKEVALCYAGHWLVIERYDGYSFSSLAHKFFNREMEPMLVTINEGVAPELVQHTGQEFNYVLSGKLRVLIGNKEYYLRAGDSIYFDPNIPHAQVSMQGESTFLTVILEK